MGRVVALVGGPGSGKSYISSEVCRYHSFRRAVYLDIEARELGPYISGSEARANGVWHLPLPLVKLVGGRGYDYSGRRNFIAERFTDLLPDDTDLVIFDSLTQLLVDTVDEYKQERWLSSGTPAPPPNQEYYSKLYAKISPAVTELVTWARSGPGRMLIVLGRMKGSYAGGKNVGIEPSEGLTYWYMYDVMVELRVDTMDASSPYRYTVRRANGLVVGKDVDIACTEVPGDPGTYVYYRLAERGIFDPYAYDRRKELTVYTDYKAVVTPPDWVPRDSTPQRPDVVVGGRRGHRWELSSRVWPETYGPVELKALVDALAAAVAGYEVVTGSPRAASLAGCFSGHFEPGTDADVDGFLATYVPEVGYDVNTEVAADRVDHAAVSAAVDAMVNVATSGDVLVTAMAPVACDAIGMYRERRQLGLPSGKYVERVGTPVQTSVPTPTVSRRVVAPASGTTAAVTETPVKKVRTVRSGVSAT